jgi:hypothetical protein
MERREVASLCHRPDELLGVATVGVEIPPVLVREAGADVSDAPAQVFTSLLQNLGHGRARRRRTSISGLLARRWARNRL